MNNKIMYFFFSLMIIAVAAGAYYMGQQKSGSDFSSQGSASTEDVERHVATGPSPEGHIQTLNQKLLDVKREEQSKSAGEYLAQLDDIAEFYVSYISKNKISKDDPEYPAIKIYELVAKATPVAKSVLWRMGEFIMQSEYIYAAIIDSLMSVKYSRHMYSPVVELALDYMLMPGTNNAELYNKLYVDTGILKPSQKQLSEVPARFSKISAFQDYLFTELIPVAEMILAEAKEIEKNHPGLSFQYDRALVAGGDGKFASEVDRYATFIQPYLSRAIAYSENSIGFGYLATAYYADTLPNLLNQAFYKSVKKSSVVTVRNFFRKATPLNKLRNVHLNTHYDYSVFLEDQKYANLFTLYDNTDQPWSNGEVANGQAAKEEALNHFKSAITYDISFRKAMDNYAGKSQDGYVVDANEVVNDPDLSLERFQKIQTALERQVEVIDPVTGKTTSIDIPKLFAKGFTKDLKTFWPKGTSSFDFPKDIYRKVTINGTKKPTYNYTSGRPVSWPDATFGGLLPKATSLNLYETHRILTYNGDLDIISNTILGLVL